MNYQYSHTIGFLSVSGRGFNNPVDLAVGGGGALYVLNRAGSDVAERMVSKRISICSVDEDYYGEFGMGGSGDGQMMWPCAMEMSADGNLFISDEALHRISVFSADGDFLGSWGAQGKGAGEFNRPSGIAFDNEGNLLVADGLNNRIQRFTPDGRYLGGWGRDGRKSGRVQYTLGRGGGRRRQCIRRGLAQRQGAEVRRGRQAISSLRRVRERRRATIQAVGRYAGRRRATCT